MTSAHNTTNADIWGYAGQIGVTKNLLYAHTGMRRALDL